MNELSLFSGAGGGLLATKHFLNWRTVGYVEFNNYCQQVLAKRIEDGFLDEAPIFGDIDGFIESGAAKKYRGVVEVLSAGFPCQPFSAAGKQRGQEDDRNKWPQTIQCVRDIRPRYVWLENVPGLLNSGYFGEILSSLAEAGYDARWTVLGADQCGAPHRRRRLWVLANSKGVRWPQRSDVDGYPPKDEQTRRRRLPDTTHSGREGRRCIDWPAEPRVGRVVPHGMAHRMDRLAAIGNGQVSRVVAAAWEELGGQNLEII